jgi:probable F420-dependent oxidoreductase
VKFLYEFPGRSVPMVSSLMTATALSEVAVAAEQAGFDGVGLPEHPAPPESWRHESGHDGIDPFLGLAAVAAATRQIRLVTHVTIVPYRNPLLLAKTVATLDLLCEGRLVLGVGTGYLEAEFSALGVDFARRNELFDESIDVCRLAWTGEPVTYRGAAFDAEAVTVQPPTVQQPHPPIWIGGNSTRSLKRVAAFGQGWTTLPHAPGLTVSRRTSPLGSFADLGRYVERLRDYVARAGRTDSIDVSYGFGRPGLSRPAVGSQLVEFIHELAETGVTWVAWPGEGTTVQEATEAILRFRDEVISSL